MTPKLTRAALGFRAHSGWAALVAIATSHGTRAAPTVIGSQRIALIDRGIPPQPYHAAAKMDIHKAERFIAKCKKDVGHLARQALRGVIVGLRDTGHEPVACGIVLASGRPLPALAATLRSHAMIHTAEGEFFREVLIRAGEHYHLRVTGIPERELYARGAEAFRVAENKLKLRITEMGETVGRPWTQDQKQATLAAWLALAEAQ
ncbi:MAG: hypothetical protein ACRD50_02920 [Candidatus Acidiferrales bacterium]